MNISMDRVRGWVTETMVGMTGNGYEFDCPHAVLVSYDQAVAAGFDGWDEDGTPTHYLRFVLPYDDATCVDGDGWWVRIGGEEIELLTLPDAPAYQGDTVEEVVAWCEELRS